MVAVKSHLGLELAARAEVGGYTVLECWPQSWPSAASDYVAIMGFTARKSTGFGRKSTKKHVKWGKKPMFLRWVVEAASSSLVTQTRRRFTRISSFLLFSPFFSFFHVYKVLTAIFIPAKNRRNSRHDHIRDHRFFKLHPLITFFGFFSKNFGGSLLLRTAFFMFFLIFQSLQQCISFK